MTTGKFGVGILALVGVGASALRMLVLSTIVDPALPEWLTIVSMVGMPAVSLLGIIFTLLHVESRIHHSEHVVQGHVDRLESTVNGKMTELLRLNREAYLLEGEIRGRQLQIADMSDHTIQVEHDLLMQKKGAANLLVAQATPPAVEHSEP